MVVLPKHGRVRPPGDSAEPAKPWRERLEDMRTAYGNIPRAFRLVWGADKRSTIVMAALTLLSGFLPLAQAWAGGLILNSVTSSLQQRVDPWLGLEAALPD